ncbi:MAG: multicopper oxidase domain-containing protein, partial [Gammaproteobacteria bacterium]
GNWDTVQDITVTGVDDTVVDGDRDYQVEFTVQSNDADYDGITIAPVSVTNQDNDTPATPGITVTPTAGLVTSEDATATTVSLVLESQPSDVVTINVASSDTMEGTVEPAVLEFTAGNWDTVQDITVTGVDDTVVDGDRDYQVEFTVQSNDADYDGITIAPVSVTNQDNDTPATPGITVTPAAGLMTSEDATSDEFTVVLDAQPAAEVTIGALSSDESEGTVLPASLVFDAGNWDTAQTVTVTGMDDSDVDGDISYSVQLTVQSNDANYDGLTVPGVEVVNQDNDVAPPPPVPDPVSYNFFVALGDLEITASEISGNGADTFPVWGFSQTLAQIDVPGQVIEAVTGQTVNVEVVNDHFLDHSFEVTGLLTGTPLIVSGATGNFQFTPQQAGVYLYYDPDLRSREMGMFGAVVVRPADGSNTAWEGGPAFDQERTWVITDMDDSWNRVSTFLPVDTTQYNPNYFLLNGKNGFAAKQDPLSTLEGTVGETFLVRIVNAGQYDQSLHFHANHFQIISQDGVKADNIADAPWVTTVNVKRGSTAMVLYTLDKPGTYPVHVHSAQMETGNGVYLNGTATYIIAQ